MKAIILSCFLFISSLAGAQRGQAHYRGHGPRPGPVVVRPVPVPMVRAPRHFHRDFRYHPYRPHRLRVYHPYWAPGFAFHRRWVFFPGYNLYWDNWHNCYVYFRGGAWVSAPALPPGISKQRLHKQKYRELRESDDDLDDIYRQNEDHRREG